VDDGTVVVCSFPPVDFTEIAQNTAQRWITPLRYEPGKEYKMRNGTRRYIADNNGALRRAKEQPHD
jgi:hypothetical protein